MQNTYKFSWRGIPQVLRYVNHPALASAPQLSLTLHA